MIVKKSEPIDVEGLLGIRLDDAPRWQAPRQIETRGLAEINHQPQIEMPRDYPWPPYAPPAWAYPPAVVPPKKSFLKSILISSLIQYVFGHLLLFPILGVAATAMAAFLIWLGWDVKPPTQGNARPPGIFSRLEEMLQKGVAGGKQASTTIAAKVGHTHESLNKRVVAVREKVDDKRDDLRERKENWDDRRAVAASKREDEAKARQVAQREEYEAAKAAYEARYNAQCPSCHHALTITPKLLHRRGPCSYCHVVMSSDFARKLGRPPFNGKSVAMQTPLMIYRPQ